MHNLIFRRALFCAFFTIISATVFSQTATNWTTSGNTTNNSAIFGTLNNQPIIFYTNNAEAMRLKPNGDLRINSLGGTGNNFVFSKSDGLLYTKPFSSDTDKFLTEAGIFRTASSFTGWKMVGNTIHSVSGTYVGIGTNNPQYILDVNGTVRFNGTVNATGINIVNKLQADTLKGVSLIRVNNTLQMTGGVENHIYTTSGDLQLESGVASTGNTLINVYSGNVGVGIYSPQYKFDVNGDVQLNGKTHVYRIVPLQGDTLIRFGDSTIYFNPSQNLISSSTIGLYKGITLGFGINHPYGNKSICIGQKTGVDPNASSAIVIGLGPSNGPMLNNNQSNSLMIGFNTDIPTLFVGQGSGSGTLGKVGIGTASPHALFQVGENYKSVEAGSVNGNAGNDFSISYFGMNGSYDAAGQWNFQSDLSHNGGVVMEATINGNLNIYTVNSNGSPGITQTLNDASLKTWRVMELTSKGRVVIGKELDPSQSQYNDDFTHLTVDGRIVCKDLVVNINGFFPDYVFDPNYKLMSMDSLGQYVALNKHLPATPPAAQLEQNGASLSELCTAQQKQIEELTLYILQLNQRLEAIEANQNASK